MKRNPTYAVTVWRIVRIIVCVLASAACLAPSAMMNIRVRQEMGGDLSVSVACVAAVVLAAVCVIIAENSWKTRQFQRLFWLAPVFAVLFSFNISNAIGLSGANRAAFSEPRRAAQETKHSLIARLATMQTMQAEFRKASGGKTPGMISAAVEALRMANQRVWNRTGHCRDVTRDDSGAFCAGLAQMTAKLAAARKVEALDARIAVVQARLDGVSAHGETEHPYIRSLVSIYGAFWKVTDRRREQIRICSDVLFGVTVEIIAAFGPALAVLLLWPAAPARAPKAKAKAKNEPKERPANDSAGRFLAECVNAKRGGNVAAADLYGAYRLWATEKGLAPISQTAFGREAGKLYRKRRIDGRMSYLDVQLKEQLMLVAA